MIVNNEVSYTFCADIDPPDWYTPGAGEDCKAYHWINLSDGTRWTACYKKLTSSLPIIWQFIKWEMDVLLLDHYDTVYKMQAIMGLP